jgi:hypothetical protein
MKTSFVRVLYDFARVCTNFNFTNLSVLIVTILLIWNERLVANRSTSRELFTIHFLFSHLEQQSCFVIDLK